LPFDPRQARAASVIAGIASSIAGSAQSASRNFETGFHASAVNVGALQQALERGLARFRVEQRDERWDEIGAWIQRVIAAWVQRRKLVSVDRAGDAIHVAIETQDDLGYYRYAFDVFPRRSKDRAT
jgi:hypothetical protein